jgi:hypothetical protein
MFEDTNFCHHTSTTDNDPTKNLQSEAVSSSVAATVMGAEPFIHPAQSYDASDWFNPFGPHLGGQPFDSQQWVNAPHAQNHTGQLQMSSHENSAEQYNAVHLALNFPHVSNLQDDPYRTTTEHGHDAHDLGGRPAEQGSMIAGSPITNQYSAADGSCTHDTTGSTGSCETGRENDHQTPEPAHHNMKRTSPQLHLTSVLFSEPTVHGSNWPPVYRPSSLRTSTQ